MSRKRVCEHLFQIVFFITIYIIMYFFDNQISSSILGERYTPFAVSEYTGRQRNNNIFDRCAREYRRAQERKEGHLRKKKNTRSHIIASLMMTTSMTSPNIA
jgi:hypothetical protein